jgi:hypothetical protein
MLSSSSSSSDNGADDITTDTSAPTVQVEKQPVATTFCWSKMIEICGLLANSNGRSCRSHETCGLFIKVNNTLRLKECIVITNNKREPAIKLLKTSEGSETCTVVFIPRMYYKLPMVQNSINGLLQVVLLYKDGTTYKKHKDHANKGMVSYVFMDDIPMLELLNFRVFRVCSQVVNHPNYAIYPFPCWII